MSSEGYPDYTRLSRSGGVLLGSATGNINSLQQLFKGYVGNFPYVAVTISVGVSADFASVNLLWYSDSTFTTLVGFRRVIRSSGQFSETQYVNLSDWLLFYVETKSGAAMPFGFVSAYGCQAPGNNVQLVSTDVPMWSTVSSVPATTTDQFVIPHVQPGAAHFTLQTVAASWFVNVNYYDWGAGAYTLFRQFNSTKYVSDISEDLPCLDSSIRIDIHNGDAAAKTFVSAWLSD